MALDLKLLFDSLIIAARPEEVAAVLASLGDSQELGLNEEIGSSGLFWQPIGDDPGNLSAINLAQKPGRSLAERITNGIDALLESRARHVSGTLPRNPRDAAQLWFGRPVTTADQGLFTWNYGSSDDDQHIHVTLLESGREEAPTIDVLDDGIGISARDFPKTILSLRSGNKISKFYLIGAFGQGGSSTLGFSEYGLYASRHEDSPQTISFSVIRVLRLSDAYKEDCYAYLALRRADGSIEVPSFTGDPTGSDLYGAADGVKMAKWVRGTLVRHIGFRLTGLAGALGPSPGNLYHFLHALLFDPLLPFRVVDLRQKGTKPKDELVSGSRNRLMNYTRKKVSGDDASGELRHYRPMEFIVPPGETDPCIGIEYWVVLNWRKPPKGSSSSDRILRPSSNELFVQKGFPVVGTLNGQNQGELGTGFFKRLTLGMVGRHIVVHIDASRAPSHVRRVLFSSTREGFKDGPVLTSIERVLGAMLTEDEDLAKLERELGERMVEKESKKTEDDVKQQITRLLLDSGMAVSDPGAKDVAGAGEEGGADKKKRARYKKKDPLPTLPFPDVTHWAIVSPADSIEIHLADFETVLVETDAAAEFDRRGLVGIRSEPPALEVGTKAALSGGRVRWRLRTADGAKEGVSGTVFATLTKPDGTQFVSSCAFKVLPRLPEPVKKAKGVVPPFEVLPIDPTNDDDREIWGQLWPELADETDQEKLSSVAYKTNAAAGKKIVYFNVLFPPFRNIENGYLMRSKGLAELFRVQYKVWVGYHALLQEADSADERAEAADDLVERTLEEETKRVATMQAKQAAQFVELKKAAMKADDSPSA